MEKRPRPTNEECANVMAMLAVTGQSCATCRHQFDDYYCPWEPDARSEIPVIEGAKLCQRHSEGPLSKDKVEYI